MNRLRQRLERAEKAYKDVEALYEEAKVAQLNPDPQFHTNFTPVRVTNYERLKLIGPDPLVQSVPIYQTAAGTVHTKSLLALAVGNTGLQSGLVNEMVVAFGSGVGHFTLILFHYDNADFTVYPWYNDAVHIAVQGQMKWWYAKRFLTPAIVAGYEYLFLWDEDLDVRMFRPEEYLHTCRSHRLALSTPAYDKHRTTKNSTWKVMLQRDHINTNNNNNNNNDNNKENSNSNSVNSDSSVSSSVSGSDSGVRKTNFVEVSAPVFRADAWACVWQTVQNDLSSGWGYDLLWYNACKEVVGGATAILDSNVVAHISGGSASGSQNFRPRARKEEKEFFARMHVKKVRPGTFVG